MAETKQLLERAKRAFDPPSDVMGALVVRRDRKRRDQRVRAVALVLAIAIGMGWLGVIAIRSTPPVPADPPDLPNTPESWSRVQLDAPVDGGEDPGHLFAGPGGLAAVGVRGGPATAWTSFDGASWTQTPSEGLDGGYLSDISSGGPGFIAIGSVGPEGGNGEEAIWTSEDGVSWNRLPYDPVFGDTLFVSAVAPGGPGQVAVGSWMGAWYSSDGSTWERASVPPVPPEIYPGDNGQTPQIYLTDVAAQEDRLVATGWGMLASDGNGDHPVVVVWTSRDGRSWNDVPTPADVFPQDSSISDITAGPDGFVAVGQITVGEVSTPAIWSSPDGRDWRLHRPGPDGLQLSSVAAGDSGYVAVGATMACDTDCASREAVVMTSVDGETWVRVPSGPEFRVAQPGDPGNASGAAMDEVVAWGSRFAALGEYDGEPTVWVTTLGVSDDAPTPAPHLGIFAPVAGGIAYGDRYGIWAVDPAAPAGQAAPVQLTSHRDTPLAWSSDGTELLIMRVSPRQNGGLVEHFLSILHADGSETPVPTDRMTIIGNATISPDGSRVVFAAQDGPGCCGPMKVYAFDTDTGSVEVLRGSQNGFVSDPTFSPDGAQIAYVDGSGDHSHHVWVMNADGSQAHEIVFNETTTAAGHVLGLAWSPAGDRIALGFDVGIYTFAPDGSAFTQVTDRGTSPYWSPDGSQIAYTVAWPYSEHGVLAIVDADGSNDRAFDFGVSGPWHPGQSTR